MLIRALPFLLCLGLASPAFAEEDKLLGRSGAWEAHKLLRDGETTCYAIARPKSSTPKKLKRDETYFMVSYWPTRDKAGEPSLVGGYSYDDGSTADVKLGKSTFRFFTKADGAWLAEAKEEVRLVGLMRKTKTMTVAGTSARGTKTTDSYSLSGFGPALDKAAKACK
jgi:hypothetical protein